MPHPTTPLKITARCGPARVDGLNEALLAKAAEAELVGLDKVRVDTTVVKANVSYPTDSGLLGLREATDHQKQIDMIGLASRSVGHGRARRRVSAVGLRASILDAGGRPR